MSSKFPKNPNYENNHLKLIVIHRVARKSLTHQHNTAHLPAQIIFYHNKKLNKKNILDWGWGCCADVCGFSKTFNS